MVYVIKIKNLQDLDRTITSFKGIHRKLPEMTSTAMFNWGNELVRDIKQSAYNSHITPFTGRLYSNGIRWEQRPKGKIGRLFMVRYGVALDSMPNHWVNMTPNRTRLLLWGGQAHDSLINNAARNIQSGLIKKHAIFVRKHPFIRQGFNVARPKLRIYIRNELNKIGTYIGG